MSALISIITVNFNNAVGLEETFRSIVIQDWPNWELLVIDGGSSDASLEMIRKFEKNICYFVSEDDNGIYHAQNKGLAAAKGEFVIFMNSGDYFLHDRCLSYLGHAITDKTDIVYGNLLIQVPGKESWTKIYPSEPDLLHWRYDTLPHNGSIIRTTKLRKAGGYDESLLICADWKFFLHARFKMKLHFQYVNETIAHFNCDGLSSRPESKQIISNERMKVWHEYFPKPNIILRALGKIKKIVSII